MTQVDPDTASVRIELFAGNGQRFAAFFPITAGLNSLPLSGFNGLTDLVAADIDGIEFSGQAGGTSVALGNGHIFNRIAITVAGPTDTTRPVLTLPDNITAEATSAAGALVNYTASANDDVDGAVSISCVPASGSTFPRGTTTVNCSASDAAGNIGDGIFAVTVQDTTAPAIADVTPSQSTLWPPNHQMVPITVNASATDAVGVISLKIIEVVSSEPDNGLGDGDTAGDIQVTGDLTLNLRAERGGKGNGRTYTITVEARDEAGNASTRTCTVYVPKSLGKK